MTKPLSFHEMSTSTTSFSASFTSENSEAIAQLAEVVQIGARPTLVAGDPNGTPVDSPDNRIDPNTADSPFAGVGSLELTLSPSQSFLCSGTAISSRHILTAAHCLDVLDEDGVIDLEPENVVFNVHVGGDFTSQIAASALTVFPEYTGFSTSVNNDLAIITLSEDLPDTVPIYDLYREPLLPGTELTLVGYGTSGNGIDGFADNSANAAIKRVGKNQVEDTTLLEVFVPDLNESFLIDFDGPDATTNTFAGLGSGLTLGNDIETTVGPGDSGGPSFVEDNGDLKLAAVNTFVFAIPDLFAQPDDAVDQGTFGGGAGGVKLSDPDKLAWIDSILNAPPPVTLPGTIQGVVWNDLNGNGIQDATETGLESQTVFLDTNQNGLLDSGETSATTDAAGLYTFTDLNPGSYPVAYAPTADLIQTFPQISALELFRADFSDEAGNPDLDGFTLDNTGGTVPGLWHLSQGRGNQNGHSADDSLYFGTDEGPDGGGNYNVTPSPLSDRTAGRVTSPLISLTAVSEADLSFNYFLNVEPALTSDVPEVLISANGGAFQPIAEKGSELIVSSSSETEWRSLSLSLDSYIGSSIQIQFDFDTIDGFVNTLEGWYIDDVVVSGTGAAAHTVALSSGQTVTGVDFGTQLSETDPPLDPPSDSPTDPPSDPPIDPPSDPPTDPSIEPAPSIIQGTDGDDILMGTGTADVISGKAGDDVLKGRGGDDSLDGGSGSDRLLGRRGNDTLIGNGDDDVLIGGPGRDQLLGGAGRDRFVFKSIDDRRDRILDFNPNRDLLVLRPLFNDSSYSGDPLSDYVRLVQRGSNIRLRVDVDGGPSGNFKTLAILENVSIEDMTEAAFLV